MREETEEEWRYKTFYDRDGMYPPNPCPGHIDMQQVRDPLAGFASPRLASPRLAFSGTPS